MNYTAKSFNKQDKNLYRFSSCSPYHRCNDTKKCKTCRIAWRKKNYSKITNHLNENDLKNYRYKKFIVITSKSLDTDYELKNKNVDLFMEQFRIMKRNKNFVIDKDSEYIITKEISHSKELGYNPHNNIILFSNKDFDINNNQLQKLATIYNIDIHITDIYKAKEDKSYLTSLKKLVNYSMKYEDKRSELESQDNITKYKRDIHTTTLFNREKYQELQRSLCIYIKEEIKVIKRHYKAKLIEANRIFRKNTQKTSPKNYLRLLKSLKNKKNKYSSAEAYYIGLERRRLPAIFT